MKILSKKILCDSPEARVTQITVSAPDIALKAKPGQFVVLMLAEEGERIPLTIVNNNTAKGAITLIFQETGLTTKLLGKLNEGDQLYAIVGPLGHATEIKNYGTVILVGGGVGIAEIYPVAKAMKAAGNKVITILGARTKNLLILEKELKEASDELHVATDDGSYGKKGFVTDILKEVLVSGLRSPVCGLIYAVGPIPMMKAVSKLTKEFNVRTLVSLNAIMVDATGMCGCCRVTVGGKTMFSCVDGPEFDGHAVDWDELTTRNRVYNTQEKHICKLNTTLTS